MTIVMSYDWFRAKIRLILPKPAQIEHNSRVADGPPGPPFWAMRNSLKQPTTSKTTLRLADSQISHTSKTQRSGVCGTKSNVEEFRARLGLHYWEAAARLLQGCKSTSSLLLPLLRRSFSFAITLNLGISMLPLPLPHCPLPLARATATATWHQIRAHVPAVHTHGAHGP